jgi:hypothetical protein
LTRPKVFVKVIHFHSRLISEKSFTVIFPLSPSIEFLIRSKRSDRTA